MWLTYEQQNQHFINWEMTCIEYGFGRAPESREERLAHGNVVFFEGALDCMLHIDEMSFHYDGSKNGIGGRPCLTYSNPDVPDAGEPNQKSSDKVSILFGATYSGQAIPPLIVFPSTAQQPKLDAEMLFALHQIKGMFGWTEERLFDCLIGKWKALIL